MYYEDNVKIRIDWKGLILKLIAVVLLILVFIWLFPMPKLDTFYNRVYNDNLANMREVAEKYFTGDKLPTKTGESNTIKLQEMLDKKLITEFTDKNNNACSTTNSFAQVTKTENNNYVLKVQLSCDEKTDYILENVQTTNTNRDSSSSNNDSNKSNNEKEDNNDNSDDDGIEIDESSIRGGDSKYDKGSYIEYEYKRAITKTATTYKCPEGYVQDGNVCYKYETGETVDAKVLYFDDEIITTDAKKNESGKYTKTAEPIKTVVSTEMVCPEGYTKNGNICYKYVNATVVPGTTTYKCPDGYQLNGTSCITYADRIEEKVVNASCPSSDYELSADKKTCTRTIDANKSTTPGSTTCTCPQGYHEENGTCVKQESYTGTYHPGTTTYGNCPSGWSASGNQCVRAADVTTTWSNPTTQTSSTPLSEFNNGSAKRVLVSKKCSLGSCTYTYHYYTAIKNYSCPQGNRSGSSCYISRPSTTTSPYYTCNDGRTQSSSTCYRTVTASKTCKTTPGSTTYSCPSDYNKTSDGTHCYKTVNAGSYTSTSYKCPQGYSMNGDRCSKATPASPVKTETQYECPVGYVREGTTCYQYTEQTEKKTYSYSCPEGYTKNGEGEKTTCTMEVESKTTYYCENSDEELVDDKCIKRIKGAIRGYTCDSGYILKNDKCVKKTLECAPLEEVKTNSTTYEYKWSADSELEGWTKTGKTRGGSSNSENLYDK